MNTQILSKNELVINAEEEGEKENKQKTNGHGKHGEKKGKQEVQLLNNLNYQQIPLPCLRNKTKTRQKLNENN